ncbi:MAG: outer membrane protein Omp31 precursor, partial [Hyphomicrobiales bacterium]|nr:outer membrane protein Omp31 precursor [Hyphomicrobiales bacterium]
ALSTLSFGALAADLPSRIVAPSAPYLSPVASNWTGFYVGVHAGYDWTSGKSAYINSQLSAIDVNTKPDGIVGGAQVGYNYQFSNNVVVGVEADLSGAGIKDTIADRASRTLGNTITAKIDYTATVRARLGYAMGAFLPYLTGGYAMAHSKVSATDGPLSASATLQGWTIGGGAEYALTSNVSLKAEYLHTMFRSHTFFANQSYASTAKPNSDTVRIGVNYKF